MRRITNKPWFGPKKYIGWGWRITSWQGFVILMVFIGFLISDLVYSRRGFMGIVGAILISIAFVYVALITGGPPGGPGY